MISESRYVAYEGPRQLVTGVVEIPPETKAGGLLKIEACGVCGSDWNTYQGRNNTIGPSSILGHEIVGTVVALADDRPWSMALGDRVLLEEFLPCFHCDQCLEGRHRKCPNRWKYGNTSLAKSPALWGGFADYVYIHPAAVAYHVPTSLDSITATAAIPISNGISWVTVAGGMRIGDTVLIAGPGQQGLGCLIAAHYTGARKVIITGLASDSFRFETARRLHPDVIIVDVGSEDVVEVCMRETDGRGVDVAVDTTPMVTSVVDELIHSVRIGARIVLAGLKRGQRAEIDTDVIAGRELSVVGVGARESWCIPHALTLLEQHEKHLEPLRGEVFPLFEAESAIRTLGGDLESQTDVPAHTVVVPDRTAG